MSKESDAAELAFQEGAKRVDLFYDALVTAGLHDDLVAMWERVFTATTDQRSSDVWSSLKALVEIVAKVVASIFAETHPTRDLVSDISIACTLCQRFTAKLEGVMQVENNVSVAKYEAERNRLLRMMKNVSGKPFTEQYDAWVSLHRTEH